MVGYIVRGGCLKSKRAPPLLNCNITSFERSPTRSVVPYCSLSSRALGNIVATREPAALGGDV